MGGGGEHGSHGHAPHAPHEVPDWRIYKAEGIPELDRLQKRLAALGLKDPWIRNEVWRFHPSVGGSSNFYVTALRSSFRGFGMAVAALAVTIAFDKLTNKGKDDHLHGGHH